MPVRLWHNRHVESFSLEYATYNGHGEGRMVYVGIGREEYHVYVVPAETVYFFASGGEEGGCHTVDVSYLSRKDMKACMSELSLERSVMVSSGNPRMT